MLENTTRRERGNRVEHRHVCGHRQIRILLYDDEVSFRRSMKKVLVDMGYAVVLARGVDEARSLAATRDVDIIFLDIVFAKRNDDGIDLAERIQQEAPDKPILLITGVAKIPQVNRKIKECGLEVRVLTKPNSEEELRELEAELAAARQEIEKREIIAVLASGDRQARQTGLDVVRQLCSGVSPEVYREVEIELRPAHRRYEYLRRMCDRLHRAATTLQEGADLEKRLGTYGELRLDLLDSLREFLDDDSPQRRRLTTELLMALRRASAINVQPSQIRAFQSVLKTLAGGEISAAAAADAHSRLERSGVDLELDYGTHRDELLEVYKSD